ncbi:S9 family peptidase [Runella sp. SP2]|uniref:alpha/beta hydrolase family protein n=1 Tax=Runella sp. SP2 TaxID=2268026 RepID=UPI000F078E05|nr:acetylxylan esterase [Runella sp. SP2]AYQ34352.1 acetylxylan esterase [Runella sp. SP2]
MLFLPNYRGVLWVLASVCTVFTAVAQKIPVNYDESQMPAYTLPNPLVLSNGKPVTSVSVWEKTRRPELRKLFAEEVYGVNPFPSTIKSTVEVKTVNENALGGKAISKQITLRFPTISPTAALNILLYLPKNAKKAPAFVSLNFTGNHSTTHEKEVLVTENWVNSGFDKSFVNNRATETSRGIAERRWPYEAIVARGYAVATAYYGDLEPDHAEGWKTGIRSVLTPEQREKWSALGVWAWSMSRMVDYLIEHEGQIDAKKIIGVGHSRIGKATLWAGAEDPRFAVVISNDSGEGGAALARRWIGETVEHLNTQFPHWFCANYKKYNKAVAQLPVDQHELLSLIAPRPLYVASASKDTWADPKGEFLSAVEAGKVYQLYKKTGLGTSEMPAVNTSVGQSIGYHLRDGGHDILLYDWEQYMNFIDKHIKIQ